MRVCAKLLAAALWLAVCTVGPSAEAAADPCAQAEAQLEAGHLTNAASLGAVVGGDCKTDVERLVGQAQVAAQRLAELAADAVGDEEKTRLAPLALSLDDANTLASTVLDSLKQVEDATLCAEADRAVTGGALARAQALFDALKDVEAAESCRALGLVKLAEAREARGPTRVEHFVLEDGLTTWLVALAAFAVGVVAAGFWRFFMRWLPTVAFTVAIALGLVTWQWQQPSPLWHARWNLWVLAALLAFAAVAGLLLSNAVRSRAPLRITVTGDDKEQLAPKVLAELHALGESDSRGVYAQANTDVSDSGVAGVLEEAATPVVKAVLALWSAVQLKTADRVEIAVAADGKTPASATVMLYRGRRLDRTSSVDGAQYCASPAKPTETELADSPRDVATAVAAAVLLWRLRDVRAVPSKKATQAEARLYGATDPVGVALAAVAARRLASGDRAAAGTLFSRAVDRDPKNRSARLGRVTTSLRTYPGGPAAQRLIQELAELNAKEERDSPLKWRIVYNMAAATANSALAGTEKPDLQHSDVVKGLTKAAEQFDGMPPPGPAESAGGSRDAGGVDAKEADGRLWEWIEESLDKGAAVVETDLELWKRIRRMSEVASLGLRVQGTATPAPGSALETLLKVPLETLLEVPLSEPSSVQHNVACGLALAYARTEPSNKDERKRRVEYCVDRLRLAGHTTDRRAELLADPFLAFVADTEPFVALRKEWGVVREDPYASIDAIGKQSEKLAESYPRPRDLAMALSTGAGRRKTVETYGVDGYTVGRWAGAAVWLNAGQPASRINLYQASGYQDAEAVASADDSVVLTRLTATAKVAGIKDLPTSADRAAMARPRR